MKSRAAGGRWVVGWGVLITAVMMAAPAWAASATWNGTSSAIWATGGNWSATPVPGSGDTATFNNAGNGNTTLDLGSGVTIGNLVFDTATAYILGSGGSGAQSLTLNNGGGITLTAANTSNQRLDAPLTLGTDGSTQTFAFNLNAQILPYGGIVGSTGPGTKTIVFQGAPPGLFAVYNHVNGISDGAGGGKVALTVNLANGGIFTSDTANDMSGSLVLRRGDFHLQGAVNNFANVTDITMGLSSWVSDQARTVVTLRNSDGNNQRVNASASVTAVGQARLILRGNASAATTESLGTYTAQSGVASIDTQLNHQGGAGSSTDPMVAWSIGNLVRNTGGGIVNLQGSATETGKTWQHNLGQGSGVGNAQITATTINGAAPSSAMINGIVPWAILISSGDLAGSGRFATYSANGFKPYGFDATGVVNDNGGVEPFVTTIAGGNSASNVLLSGTSWTTVETVNGTQIINSLTLATDYLLIGGTGTIGLTSGGMITFGGEISPRIDFQGREGLIYNGVGSAVTLKGGLQNDGGKGVTFMAGTLLKADGSYMVRLQSVAGTWTGPTHVLNGMLDLNGANLLPSATALRVDANAGVNVRASNAVGSLAGGGLIGTVNPGANPVLTVGSDNTSTTFSGQIGKDGVVFTTANGENIGLTKVGTGILTLTGSNNYTAVTTVSNGTLTVNGSIASAASVKQGAILDGTGTIGGVVTVETNGMLTAGTTNTTGTLTLSSNLLLNAGSKLTCNINGSNDYDRIVVGGTTVNLNADSGAGAALQIVLGYAPKSGQQFLILDKQSSGAIAGTFSSGTVAASYGGNAYTFAVSTTGGNGNDVVLTRLSASTLVSIQ